MRIVISKVADMIDEQKQMSVGHEILQLLHKHDLIQNGTRVDWVSWNSSQEIK